MGQNFLTRCPIPSALWMQAQRGVSAEEILAYSDRGRKTTTAKKDGLEKQKLLLFVSDSCIHRPPRCIQIVLLWLFALLLSAFLLRTSL